jgi:hypothetical protein
MIYGSNRDVETAKVHSSVSRDSLSLRKQSEPINCNKSLETNP